MLNRRHIVSSLAASMATSLMPVIGHAADLPQRRYAVLSLVGDKITAVTYQMATGSMLDRNLHDDIPVTDGAFDKAALLAANNALTRSGTAAATQSLVVSEPDAFDKQFRFFQGGKLQLPADIDTAVRGNSSTHLLLITKYRSEADLKFRHEGIGSGMLEGLGFYIDRIKRTTRADTRETARGFLAPYVYIKLSLVDLATGDVVRDHAVTASTTLSAARAPDGIDPWQALDSTKKVEILRNMLMREVARNTQQLVLAA